jgi:hypothetical protein
MCGAPFKVVQDFMGHSTAEMTAHYMHLRPFFKLGNGGVRPEQGSRPGTAFMCASILL